MFLFLYKISTYILEAQLTKGKWDKIISSDGYITYFTKKLSLQLPLLDMSWLLTTDQHYIMQSIRFPQHLHAVPLKETRHWYISFLPGKTKKKRRKGQKEKLAFPSSMLTVPPWTTTNKISPPKTNNKK